MGQNNLIASSNEHHSVAKANVNVVNDIITFVEPTPQMNIIINETILMQYSSKQGLSVFGKKVKAELQK